MALPSISEDLSPEALQQILERTMSSLIKESTIGKNNVGIRSLKQNMRFHLAKDDKILLHVRESLNNSRLNYKPMKAGGSITFPRGYQPKSRKDQTVASPSRIVANLTMHSKRIFKLFETNPFKGYELKFVNEGADFEVHAYGTVIMKNGEFVPRKLDAQVNVYYNTLQTYLSWFGGNLDDFLSELQEIADELFDKPMSQWAKISSDKTGVLFNAIAEGRIVPQGDRMLANMTFTRLMMISTGLITCITPYNALMVEKPDEALKTIYEAEKSLSQYRNNVGFPVLDRLWNLNRESKGARNVWEFSNTDDPTAYNLAINIVNREYAAAFREAAMRSRRFNMLNKRKLAIQQQSDAFVYSSADIDGDELVTLDNENKHSEIDLKEKENDIFPANSRQQLVNFKFRSSKSNELDLSQMLSLSSVPKDLDCSGTLQDVLFRFALHSDKAKYITKRGKTTVVSSTDEQAQLALIDDFVVDDRDYSARQRGFVKRVYPWLFLLSDLKRNIYTDLPIDCKTVVMKSLIKLDKEKHNTHTMFPNLDVDFEKQTITYYPEDEEESA